MKITEINLGFLWDRYIPVLDATSPYEIKWDGQINKFDKFLREEPLDKVLEAVVVAFKNDYPRALFLYGALSVGFYSEIVEEGEYSSLNSKDIRRDDVLNLGFYTVQNTLGIEIKNGKIAIDYTPVQIPKEKELPSNASC